VDVLRAIALARLVLPAEIEVWAPLATLGPKLAHVALDFGASHLGYVALDGQTPNDPLLAAPSLLDELLQSISRTEINALADRASVER
jgi:2-iminoacetate synthase ThiH